MWLFTHLPSVEENAMTAPIPNTYTKPQPVLLLGAITTALTVIFGGLTTVAGLQGNKTVALIAGVGMLLTAGVNAGKDFFLKGLVVPASDAAAYRNDSGQIVTGPAAAGPDGVPAVVVQEGVNVINGVASSVVNQFDQPSNTRLGEDDFNPLVESEKEGKL
jgi:hypothetical protein